MQKDFDIIVVGGGHAGCEACYSTSTLGFKTLLITSNINNIADMPCNPSIGGTAKGIVVREIDALGGIMGKIADKSHFQIKMLNNGKGPAVRSLRAQADKILYPKNMLLKLKENKNLTIIENTVKKLIVKDNKIFGVVLENDEIINSKIVILTTGTYLKSEILIGNTKKSEGPHGEKNAMFLSDNLKDLGFNIQRLKTGTPPRIKNDSIDFSKIKEEKGDEEYLTFSFDDKPCYKIENQRPCYLLYTNEKTHKVIMDNLDKSSMYGGYVTGIGPRYCPSIEDKLVRFKDKERHQLFLEPESNYYDEWYLQGFSTSMPTDIQEKMVHSLKGLENAIISKYAYAIEYDAIDPLQLKNSLETKVIENLFTAGQINGTSGYEEAAAQGLIAGINATLKLKKKKPLILKRNESYIGVLIDDLVTKGTKEPYRLLTSRAEFRLLLRHDNADLRLRKYGYEVGLISKEQMDKVNKKEKDINEVINYFKNKNLSKEEIAKLNITNNLKNNSYSIDKLIKRPEFKVEDFKKYFPYEVNEETKSQIEILIKYEGYIAKANKEVEKLLKLENKKIPSNIDYQKVQNLASEAREKLEKIRPETIAQATRISGVNPTDISILLIYLKKEYKNE